MPSLTSNEHRSHLSSSTRLSSAPEITEPVTQLQIKWHLTPAGGRGDEEKGVRMVMLRRAGAGLQRLHQRCQAGADLHQRFWRRGLKATLKDVERSACWSSARAVLSAAIVPAIVTYFTICFLPPPCSWGPPRYSKTQPFNTAAPRPLLFQTCNDFLSFQSRQPDNGFILRMRMLFAIDFTVHKPASLISRG